MDTVLQGKPEPLYILLANETAGSVSHGRIQRYIHCSPWREYPLSSSLPRYSLTQSVGDFRGNYTSSGKYGHTVEVCNTTHIFSCLASEFLCLGNSRMLFRRRKLLLTHHSEPVRFLRNSFVISQYTFTPLTLHLLCAIHHNPCVLATFRSLILTRNPAEPSKHLRYQIKVVAPRIWPIPTYPMMSGLRSPAPMEVMDITNMLNKKGQMQIPTGPMEYHHQLPLVKAEPGMERSVSPHGSEHSQYSNHHNMARGYPSPTMMQAPMHISNPMPAAMQMTGYPDMPTMGHMPNMAMQQMAQQPPAPQQPTKQYPCSTCGKAFARRSDLARHGGF